MLCGYIAQQVCCSRGISRLLLPAKSILNFATSWNWGSRFVFLSLRTGSLWTHKELMKAHKTHKSPLIICAESGGCVGSSGVLLYLSTDRSRANFSSLTIYWHWLPLRLMLSQETLQVCSHWIKWDRFRSTSMWGPSKVGCQRFT